MARPTGIHRGTITALDGVGGAGIYVTLDRLTAGHAYGPVVVPELTTVTGAQTAGTAHTHTVDAAFAVGDKVLVGFIEGRANDVALLARL